MENALLVGLSRQMALTRELDVIANNVANIGTNGFKTRTLKFEQYMMKGASADAFPARDKPVAFVVDKGSGLDFSAGPVERTGNPLDVALRGDQLLAVRMPQGERYTRNGALQINARGELVTSDGYAVIGDAGPMVFTGTEKFIAIATDGTVSTEDGSKGRLKLVVAPNPAVLTNEGLNLYASRSQLAPAGREARIETGAIERSNVRPITEMSRLVEVNRSYASVSSMLQKMDELRRTAIQQLANVAA